MARGGWDLFFGRRRDRAGVYCGGKEGLASVLTLQGAVCWPLIHGSPCHGGRVKTAGGLPTKVDTTRLSCGVGGQDGRPLVTTRLAMER
ncbi:hypothetical protein CRG98_010018 [Punica granatum]|uniref:Uncharacterized protein n=1 Tax=Punica granatum TaxID=22663 RepID=A0A2I0KM76_PUNGR|nr:hypothetical protein CRG98_010018 [Punica granatum]